ncbi:MAG: hypothetical protein WCA39_10925 [Nitrososphaeraceae archaeon]
MGLKLSISKLLIKDIALCPDWAKSYGLKENPDLIEYIDKTKQDIQNNNDIPDRLKKLFWNEEVINVIKGNGVESHLELKDIIQIVGLYRL